MPLQSGTRLAHYDVTALIGEGGMGALGEDHQNDGSMGIQEQNL